MESAKNSKKNINRVVENRNPRTCPYNNLYSLLHKSQKFMKLFLDETRHPGISNHINYKAIGLEMRELLSFELDP